jgi:hypothetical protein
VGQVRLLETDLSLGSSTFHPIYSLTFSMESNFVLRLCTTFIKVVHET